MTTVSNNQTVQTVPIEAFGRAWQRFWHPEGSTLSLGLFRIAFAYCLFREVSVTRIKSLFAIEGGFHLPYPSVPTFIHPISEETFHLVQTMQLSLIVLLGLGLLMRPAIIGLLMLQGFIFFSDALNFRNHPYFFLLVLILLLFSHADESVSFKSIQRMYRDRQFSIEALIGPTRSMTFQRLIMVQVCLVYFLAGLQKINLAFLDGSVLSQVMARRSDDWGELLATILSGETAVRVQAILLSHEAAAIAAVATLMLEIILPFSLWYRKTRVSSFIVGILFHLSIATFMNINEFSYAMIGTYLLFLEPDTLPTLAMRLFQRTKDAGAESEGKRQSSRGKEINDSQEAH